MQNLYSYTSFTQESLNQLPNFRAIAFGSEKTEIKALNQDVFTPHEKTVSQIPVIPFEELKRLNPNSIKKLGDACSSTGIVKLRGCFSRKEAQDIRLLGNKLFSYNDDDLKNLCFEDKKDETERVIQDNQRGFFSNLTIKHLQPTDDNNPSSNESSHQHWKFADKYNIFPPEKIFSLEDKQKLLQAQMQFKKLSEVIKKCLSIYLEDHNELFAEVTDHSQDSFGSDAFKFINYPAYPEDAVKSNHNNFYRLFEHKDRPTIFGLILHANTNGIEFHEEKTNHWTRLNDTDPNAVYLFIGEKGELFTEGKLKAPLHRVTADRQEILKDRKTAAYFCRPDPMKDWVSIPSGKTIVYKGKPLSPGFWFSVLNKNENANESDYQKYFNIMQLGLEKLKTMATK